MRRPTAGIAVIYYSATGTVHASRRRSSMGARLTRTAAARAGL